GWLDKNVTVVSHIDGHVLHGHSTPIAVIVACPRRMGVVGGCLHAAGNEGVLAISANHQRGQFCHGFPTGSTTSDTDDLVVLPDEFLYPKAQANVCPSLRS